MAEKKLAHTAVQPQPLAPYQHELNGQGSACATDCPACRWLQRTENAPWQKQREAKPEVNLYVLPHREPDLYAINRNIARMIAVQPWGSIYATFAMAAHLASEAIEAAEALRSMPRGDQEGFQTVLDFWYRARDYNYAAALSLGGGNQSLPEALVTYRFLRIAA